ncbi:toll/interleukin-1 receptor domain-containing protein [Isoptericola sp. NPDC057191]|uniref:toll/interleukin-1 receptor domain-containing protein n=1 Tax=Isoptericola sp. NPDC057191 TaxID=3346041 RepID=UPI0036377C41
MARNISAAQAQAKMRAAAQKLQREVDRVNRENKRRVEEYNREVNRVNQHNARVNQQIRQTNARNQQVAVQADRAVNEINRQLRSASRTTRVVYTPAEQALTERVQHGLVGHDDREWDVFLSYARIDGSVVATELKDELEKLGVRVWFDEVAIIPGQSQALQMDKGLRKARSGVVLLTPAYLTGRFWTERELGVLLGKSTLIPVLNGVTFSDVAEYSGFLPDLAGFETARDSVAVIAGKIAGAVMPLPSDSSS